MRTTLSSYLLFFAIGQLIMSPSFAQQETQSSNFMINPFLFNPAYSSVDDHMAINMGHRHQWVGLEGSPQTSYASFHTPINKSHFSQSNKHDLNSWHGVGSVLLRDKIGAFVNTIIRLNYAYNLALTKGTGYGYKHKEGLRVALGVFLGWNNFTVNTDILSQSNTSSSSSISNTAALNDPSYQTLNNSSSEPVIDLNFGGILYYQEMYYLGLSSSQLLESSTNLSEESKLKRHYYFTGLVKIRLNESYYLIPSAISKKTAGAPTSFSFNTRLDWKDKVFVGLGYRLEDAFTSMLGTQISWGNHKKRTEEKYLLNVFYSYDLTLSALGDAVYEKRSHGAHELTIALLLSPHYNERNAEDTW